jgi:hypothetical protein
LERPARAGQLSAMDQISRPRSRYYMEKMRHKVENPIAADSSVSLAVADNTHDDEVPVKAMATSEDLSTESTQHGAQSIGDIIPLGVPCNREKSPWSEIIVETDKASVKLSLEVQEPEKLAWTQEIERPIVDQGPEITVEPKEKVNCAFYLSLF